MLTRNYALKVTQNDGKTKMIRCLGLEHITDDVPKLNVDAAYDIFPMVPYGSLDRPSGKVELLIGQDQIELLPDTEKGTGTLRLMKTYLATGWLIGGHDSRITGGASGPVSNHVQKWRSATFSSIPAIDHVTTVHESLVTYPPHQSVQHCCCHVKTAPFDFMEAELTGVMIPAKCKKCVNCPKCSFTEAGMSMKEYLELEEMRAGISYDTEARRVTFHYPYNEKVTLMHDNQHQAEKRAVSLEKSLVKRGYLEEYNKAVQDYIQRGVWVTVPRSEIDEWKSKYLHIHFMAHNCIVKEEKSTKTRIVLDATLRKNYTGPSLNDVLKKGPNSLIPLFNVFLRWRSYEIAMTLDLRQAYHQTHSGTLEKMTRLVVLRDGKADKPFKVYGNAVMGMGDKPAVNGLELTVDKAAEVGESIDKTAANKLKDDRYADDVCTGGDKQTVSH